MTYEVRESPRARHLRVTVHGDGRVVVTKPRRASDIQAKDFIESRAAWIAGTVTRLRQRREANERKFGTPIPLPKLRRGTKVYTESVERARAIATERVRHFSQAGRYRYGRISIRNQKTRWGSCSREGNLSFNLRLAFLPPHVADYLVVHELAHTRYPNHSRAFWEEVALHVPDWKARRRELHRYRW